MHVHALVRAERGDKERETECSGAGGRESRGPWGDEGGNERESGDADSKIENSRGS